MRKSWLYIPRRRESEIAFRARESDEEKIYFIQN